MLIDDGTKQLDAASQDGTASETLGPSIRERPFSQDTTTYGGPSTVRSSMQSHPDAFNSPTLVSPSTPTLNPRRFRDSTQQIPTPGLEARRPKRYEPLILKTWLSLLIAIMMIALSIAIELGLALSNGHNGFHVPVKNFISFATPSFLLSFAPTLLVAPVAYLWTVSDWMLRWYQPYVTLNRGPTPARESLLLDYIALNKFKALYVALRHKHYLVTISTATALATALFQPLAGALFELRQTNADTAVQLTSKQSLGLAPDVATLNAFVAAAGFADAAVFHNLTDPPFIKGSWAIAEFAYPPNPEDDNQWVQTFTSAVNTSVNCFAPTETKLDTRNPQLFIWEATGSYTFDSGNIGGCDTEVEFVPQAAEGQYGVVPASCQSVSYSGYTDSKSGSEVSSVTPTSASSATAGFSTVGLPTTITTTLDTGIPTIGTTASVSTTTASAVPQKRRKRVSATNATGPVLFWFYDSASARVRGVYCAPTITAHNVEVTAAVVNGSLVTVTPEGLFQGANNVTGGGGEDSVIGGGALNGFFFDTALFGTPDEFVKARAVTTQGAVPNAIFRAAGKGAFDNQDGFLNLTQQVYTQYLSIVAKSVYFVSQETDLSNPNGAPSLLVSSVPRLFINGLAAHALAVILALVGVLGIVVHVLHRRARRGLHLTAPPGSIAAIVSLTSRSGFGELLYPYDDAHTMTRKLDGLMFELDRRTGAIVACERSPVEERRKSHAVLRRREAESADDMRMSLLPSSLVAGAGQRHNRMVSNRSLETIGSGETGGRRASYRSSSSPSLHSGQPAMGYTDVPYQWEPLQYPFRDPDPDVEHDTGPHGEEKVRK